MKECEKEIFLLCMTGLPMILLLILIASDIRAKNLEVDMNPNSKVLCKGRAVQTPNV